MAKQPNQQQVLTKKHLARLEKERIQQRYLLIGTLVVLLLIVGIVIYGVLDQTVIKNMRPVAKVGNETITSGEFQKEVRFERYRLIDQLKGMTADSIYLQFFGSYILQIQSQLASPNTVGQDVIDALIESELVKREAEKRGITVTDAEVEQAFQEAFGYFENGTPTPTITLTPFSTSTLSPTQEALFPTAPPTATVEVEPTQTPTEPPATATPEASPTPTSAFTATPEPTATITPSPTPYTKEGFDKNVGTYVDDLDSIGYNENDLRAMLRRELLRKKVFEAITKDVPPSSEQVWARHILVATEEEATAAIDLLNRGEKFADLASQLSTDTSNKDQGGDLGWFAHGKMVKEFEDVAFALKVGEISQPVKTEFGYHVIQVLGHEVRNLDAGQLEEAKQTVYNDWLAAAKTEANVETYDSTWQEIVPTEPEIPAEILSVLQQLQNSMNQELPTETTTP